MGPGYVCPCQTAPGIGGLIPAFTCPSPSSPAGSAQQPRGWAQSHGDAPDLDFRLLQGLTAVVMNVCVTWLLFKQGLRFLHLCWEHEQLLSRAGHYCRASSLCSMPECVEGCTNLDQFSDPLPARGCLDQAKILCMHRGSQDALYGNVTAPSARMASPGAPPPRASNPCSQLDAQPNRQANGPGPGNLAIQIVVLSFTKQPSPKQPPADGSQLQKEHGAAVAALGFAG